MISVWNRRRGLSLLLFVILTLLIYSNTLEVPFYFDDEQNIDENPFVWLTNLTFQDITRAASESPVANRPIANISFALNYYFHQDNVIGYHAINIFIHLLAGILLYFFIKTTLSIPSLRSRYQRHSSIAFFAALLWIVHPIQTQSVTYIVQRMNSMAAMFYVLSFLLYVKGRLVKQKQKSWPRFAGCALSGILAVGSKEIAVTLPFFVLIYEWYFFQDLSTAWLKRHLPCITGTFIGIGLLVFWYLGSNPLEAILSGYAYRDFTLKERILTEFRVAIHYTGLLFYPHPCRLNLDYDFPVSHSLLDPITTFLSMGAIVVLIGLAFLIAKKERLISFCILWFLGNLAIESSVIPLEIIYEHRIYLPSMSFFLLIVGLAYRYIQRDWAIIGVLGAASLVLCFWTYQRNSVWREPVTFWKDCSHKSPKKARPHNNLGVALAEQGRLEEAIGHYAKALQIKPCLVEAHNNLGRALAKQGRFEEAIGHYSKALQIKPDYAMAHSNLGVALAEQARFEEAISHFSEALEIKPNYAKAHSNLGVALMRQGNFKEAISHYAKALQINPNYADVHNNLGIALAGQGKMEEAMAQFREALRIRSDHADAHNNLGSALALRGKLREAIAQYKEALRIKPDYARAHLSLGLTYLTIGNKESALKEYQILKTIDPELAKILSQKLRL